MNADSNAPSPTDATLTASRALLGIVARSVASALEVVTLPQFRVLVLLSNDGPTRLGSLAERIGALPSTFSRSVDRMVAGGWVERSLREDNRREILLDLTEDGRRLVDSVTERRRREIRTVLDALPADDQALVARAFDAFNRAAGEPTVDDLLTLGL
ncbi:MarR family winged helix-turn-helix transcriptional regulator [Frondihabitans australicus]|uniref:MarR family transcriptional regulator n=1 Tax=Frondihabitans australicus TaxID=386892 RepID=A0A495IGA2_9MICO|nr:MarR family transcriptional regulator [Frondihabitans australicus]RKR74428.1 MarR family transcriptional regulator [Frondihabitans australicus]